MSAFCDVCQADLPEGSGHSHLAASVKDLALRGFGPWSRGEADPDRVARPSMEWPLFVRAMWKDRAAATTSDWMLCAACHAAAGRVGEGGGQALDATTDPDWFRDLLEGLERSGAQPLSVPPLDDSAEVKALAQSLRAELATVPFGQGGRLKGRFAKEGQQLGLALASVLLEGESWIGKPSALVARSAAAELLAEWDDPRAVSFLLGAVMRHSVPALGIVPLLIKRKDPRTVLPALRFLAYLLKLQDRHRSAWLEPSALIPYESFYMDQAEKLKTRVPAAEVDDVLALSINIPLLIRLVSEIGGSWGHRALREIYTHSRFRSDIHFCAEHFSSFADAEDHCAVALAVAGQGFEIGLNREDFHAWQDYLVRTGSPAGWWAMDRFCRTATHWREEIRAVRKRLSSMVRPSEEEVRRLEASYGPFLGGKPGSASKGSRCFIATAVYGAPDCPEVAVLRWFRDEHLMRTGVGRLSIRVYGAVSPLIARSLRPRLRAAAFVRVTLLDPVVRILVRLRDRERS